MTPSQIDALVQHYLTATLEEFEVERLDGRRTTEEEDEGRWLALSGLIDGTVEQLTNQDYRQIKPTVEGLLTAHGLTLSDSSPAYQRLCCSVLAAQQRAFTIELQRMSGDYSANVPGAGYGLPSSSSTSTLAQTLATGPTMAEVIPLYMEHYKHRDARTNSEKASILTRLVETLPNGDSTPVKDVTKAQCVAFRDTFARLPKRIPNGLRGKPIGEVLATLADKKGAFKGRAYVQVTHSTVNAALTDLRHFFTWAIRHDHYPGRNPVEGIDFEGVEDRHYEPYTDGDLRTLFTHPDFFDLAQRKAHPARYWLPLILLYTGARRSEIDRLTLGDVRQDEQGVWFMDLRFDTPKGRRVKNLVSVRRVPVHSHLVELGFLDLLRKGQPGRLLLVRPKRGSVLGKGRETVGDTVGKWWALLLKRCKVEGRKNLHSFRHTVVTRLTAAGVPQDMREMLVGHASDSVHGQVMSIGTRFH